MGALHHEAGTRFCVRCLARLPGGNAWISGWWSAGVALVSSARRSVGSTPLLRTQLCLARPSIHTLVHARSAKHRLSYARRGCFRLGGRSPPGRCGGPGGPAGRLGPGVV